MSKVIHKHPLKIIDEQEIETLTGAEILSVHSQRGVPCLWSIGDGGSGTEKRKVRVIGTGHPIDGDLGKYIGTFMSVEQNFVGHVFVI